MILWTAAKSLRAYIPQSRVHWYVGTLAAVLPSPGTHGLVMAIAQTLDNTLGAAFIGAYVLGVLVEQYQYQHSHSFNI